MKEQYTSPAVKLLGFAPAEDLAAQMDTLLGDTESFGQVSGAIVDPEIDIDLKL